MDDLDPNIVAQILMKSEDEIKRKQWEDFVNSWRSADEERRISPPMAPSNGRLKTWYDEGRPRKRETPLRDFPRMDLG